MNSTVSHSLYVCVQSWLQTGAQNGIGAHMTTRTNNPTQAILFVLFGMGILAFIDNTVPLVSDEISLWQFHFVRSALAVPILLIFMAVMGYPLYAKRWWAITVRCGLLAMSMVIYFGAIGFVPVSTAVAGLFAAPLVIVIITALFLSEHVGWVRWVAAAVGFFGTLLVLSPDFSNITIFTLMPLSAALFYALGAIATRELCDGEKTMPMLFMYFVMMMSIGLLGVIWTTFIAPGGDTYLDRAWVNPSALVWQIFTLQAVGSLLGIGFLLRAYLIWQATYVSIIEYSMLIFAPAVAYLYFGITVGPMAIFGMFLIVVAGSVIALRSQGTDAAQQRQETLN